MDDEVREALIALKAAVDRQTALQQQTNDLLQRLITALKQNAESIDNLAEMLGQLGPIDQTMEPN